MPARAHTHTTYRAQGAQARQTRPGEIRQITVTRGLELRARSQRDAAHFPSAALAQRAPSPLGIRLKFGRLAGGGAAPWAVGRPRLRSARTSLPSRAQTSPAVSETRRPSCLQRPTANFLTRRTTSHHSRTTHASAPSHRHGCFSQTPLHLLDAPVPLNLCLPNRPKAPLVRLLSRLRLKPQAISRARPDARSPSSLSSSSPCP